jgi:hypothetical protein
VWLDAPAAFRARHVYSPAFSALTASMLSELSRVPDVMTATPSPDLSSVPLKSYTMWIGESPLTTVHWTAVMSPAFTASNANGSSCGTTEIHGAGNLMGDEIKSIRHGLHSTRCAIQHI